MDYKNLIELEKQGKVLIGIDRIMARKFFTDIPIKKIEKETGEAPYFEKTIVMFVFLLGPVLLLISVILGFWFLDWWGIGCLILFPFIYFAYSSSSVRGGSKMTWINILLFTVIGVYFLKVFSYPRIVGLVIIFVLSLWCIRSLYCLSTFLLRSFVIRNERAYQYLSKYLVIKSTE